MLSIGKITKELRIPELKYEIGNHQETEEVVSKLCTFLDKCARDPSLLKGETSLIKVIGLQNDSFCLSPRIYNSLFLCDRLTDVFYRKANIDEQLKDILSGWRFVLGKIFVQYPKLLDSAESPVLALIDTICASQIGWAQEPKRVSQLIVDRLTDIHESLLAINSDSADVLAAIKFEWISAQENQNKRIAKLFERLVVTEQGAATSKYATEYSYFILSGALKGHQLPAAIGEFLATKWPCVLRNSLLKNSLENPEFAAEWQALLALTERLIFVFSGANRHKNESIFRQAEGLVDELASVANTYDVAIKNEEWESIQQLLISVLQGSEIVRSSVTIKEATISFDKDSCLSLEKLPEVLGNWYLVKQNGVTTRLKFARYFDDSREILWLNHAGMKSLIMPYEIFQKGIKEGSIRIIQNCYLLSQVFNETLRGLSKVAQAQHDARERAKQKAEAEAEQLRRERQQAEEQVRLKELQAAKALKEQRLKSEEKKRLEQEQLTLKIISDLSLGAWISVVEEGTKLKYKLVVKINASDKLIFVDKLGLKKFEVKTPEFMDRLISGDIEILSGGAEFDDTLSRVVGRLRVGK